MTSLLLQITTGAPADTTALAEGATAAAPAGDAKKAAEAPKKDAGKK